VSLLFITTPIIPDLSTTKKKLYIEFRTCFQNSFTNVRTFSIFPIIKKKVSKGVRTTITGRDKQIFIIKLEVLRFDLHGRSVAVVVNTCFELSWVESHSGQNDWVGVDA
jgi:hypothetical protein